MSNTQATQPAEIVLPSSGVTITESATSLFSVISPTRKIFFRGGRIHELATTDKGALVLSVLSPSQFRSRIEQYGEIKKWIKVKDDVALKAAICPAETAEALLMASPAQEILPRIRGLANCPVIASPSGNILGKGYHADLGGLLVLSGGTVPEMPVAEAVALLLGVLDEFTFTTPADKARAISMILTPALRMGGWISGNSPIFIVEADQSQTGKGYILSLLYAIYQESRSLVSKKDGGVGGFDESIQNSMLEGRPFIQLDNLRGKIDSAFLEMVLTADGMVPCRVPHRGEVAVDSAHFIFTMTSNGVETTQDLANRSCIIRLRKRVWYAFRDYGAGKDILTHIRENQPLYLGAVFAIVKAWAALGCQRTAEVRHDFRRWAQTLDWICRNVVQTQPIMDGHSTAQTSVSNPALVWLRSVAIAVEKEGNFSRGFSAADLAEISAEHDIEIPNCRSVGDDEKRKRVGSILGKLMGSGEVVYEFDSYTISRKVEYEYNHARQENMQKKSYHFAKIVPSTPQPHQPLEDSEKSGIFQKVYALSGVNGGMGHNEAKQADLFSQTQSEQSVNNREEF